MPNDSIDKFYSYLTTLTVYKMTPQELVLLLHITQKDVNKVRASWEIDAFSSIAENNYFDFTSSDIEQLPQITVQEAKQLMRSSDASNLNTEFPAYLASLASLHKRRFKFYSILKNQPLPTFQQVSPRGLLEYSLCPHKLLFTWLQWRKWIYDVDNRSAQETGYLFEPILATCLGGEPRSHKKSPVKRLDKCFFFLRSPKFFCIEIFRQLREKSVHISDCIGSVVGVVFPSVNKQKSYILLIFQRFFNCIEMDFFAYSFVV